MKTFSTTIHERAGTLVKGLMTEALEFARDAGFDVLKY